MKRQIFWKNPGYRPGAPLRGREAARFCVVGGGISGLALADALLARGVSGEEIAIVERSVVGAGSTGRSAGMLVPEAETEENASWATYVRRFGLERAQRFRAAHLDALATAKRLIREGDIDCDAYMGDWLVLARTPAARADIAEDAAARRAFGERPQLLAGRALAAEIGAPLFSAGERAHKGLSVNPLAFAQGIAAHLRRRGVRIYERTPLLSADHGAARFARGALAFDTIIYARGTAEPSWSLRNYVSTVVVTTPLAAWQRARLRLLDRDLFIDDEGRASFHYGKIAGGNRLLLGYGDLRTSRAEADAPLHEPHVRNIERFLARAFPGERLRADYAWSGAYALSHGLLPVVRVGKRAALINGAGIQLGSIALADYLAARLLGEPHELGALFD